MCIIGLLIFFKLDDATDLLDDILRELKKEK